MFWSGTGTRRLNAEAEQRLALARQNSPGSESWLALVAAALAETADVGRWRVTVHTLPEATRSARAPLLHGAEIAVDGGAVRRFVHRLADLAGLNGETPDPLEAVALVEAAICQDDSRITAADPAKLRVVAQVAALPLLVTAAQSIGATVSTAWCEGYCPVCGAWPTLAEFRGLERKRWLRCGRCATAWEMPWLRCAFCGETDHEHLGYLAPEGETSRKVEVCDTCKGYLKAEPTVSALPWSGVVLDDAATVAFDVAALDRGYHRPDRPGFDLDVHIVTHRSAFWKI